MLKDLARSLSLTNLCFMAVWPQLISQSLNPQAQYARYRFNGYVAILINVLALTFIFWITITLIRRYGNEKTMKVARWAFLLFLILPVHAVIKTQMPAFAINSPDFFFGSIKRILVSVLLIAPVAFLLFRFHAYLVKFFSIALLVMCPFAFWTLGKSVYLMTRFADKPSPPITAASGEVSPRILWLIFDEMDQRIAFAERPPGLLLPELDRLRDESVYASNAYPPSTQTLMSLPALISGRLVSSAYVASPSDLLLTFDESEDRVNWSDQPNIFSEARKLGRNTALVGWYHPYPRMIGDNLNYCVFEDNKELPLSLTLLNQLRDAAASLPMLSGMSNFEDMEFAGLRKGEEGRRRYRADMYQRMMNEALKFATDPEIGVALVHWPVPHAPVIYNRHKQDFKWGKGTSYMDNMALVDRALGELRREMESKGIWEKTIVLVTSDHPLRPKNWEDRLTGVDETEAELISRKADPRIPFVLKLAGQKHGALYDKEFNTVLTQDLFLALLNGEISTAESVSDWMDKNRSIGESPYRKRSKSARP